MAVHAAHKSQFLNTSALEVLVEHAAFWTASAAMTAGPETRSPGAGNASHAFGIGDKHQRHIGFAR